MKAMRRIKQFTLLGGIILVALGMIGCSSSTEPEGSGEITQPEEVNLREEVPDSLQENSPEAYSGVLSVESHMNLGQNMYSSIYQQRQSSNSTVTYGNLTIEYEAEPESRDGKNGTLWSATYDGTIVTDDTTITFDSEEIFSGWTADDGSAGEFTWDWGAYARASGSSEGQNNFYHVVWSTDDNGTLTATSTIQGDDNKFEYTVIIHENGSGSYEYALIDENGDVTQSNYVEWDAEGKVVS
ncbi:MAG: hypothetical protein K9N46_14055 [Candidatus Marinimicrobia bacterium]|nr:hypothetical protein [Candidatus Neomarinimicrobiota bacterium]MCF7829994.1 hypothetical protein [Candidatus Neomarinimicrobiota bacterium]MCF7881852.1 hypothetical protein [Candidatus Neomarinimicrobiota bacterium]